MRLVRNTPTTADATTTSRTTIPKRWPAASWARIATLSPLMAWRVSAQTLMTAAPAALGTISAIARSRNGTRPIHSATQTAAARSAERE